MKISTSLSHLKLRTRLLLWIGSLFVIFFLGTYVLENILVSIDLHKSEEKLYGEVNRLRQEKRKNLEDYTGIVISDMQANIDALLYELSLKKGALSYDDKSLYLTQSDLLLKNKWIDFIETETHSGSYGQMPGFVNLEYVKEYVINRDLRWIETSEKKLFGVRLPFQKGQSFHHVFFAYEPEKLSKLSIDEFMPRNSQQKAFYLNIEKAKNYLQANERTISRGNYQKLLSSLRMRTHHTKRKEVKEFIHSKSLESKLSEEEFKQEFSARMMRNEIVSCSNLISQLLQKGYFHRDPKSRTAPLGVVFASSDLLPSKMLKFKSLYFNQPFFNAKKYFEQHQNRKFDIASSIAVIYPEKKKGLILGNTLYLPTKVKMGKSFYLTIGVEIGSLLQKLSLASNETTLLVHGGRVLEVYNRSGQKKTQSNFYELPLNKMANSMGEVHLDGHTYLYMHLKPYKNTDLHFYILQNKNKAFALVNELHADTRDVIHSISLNMRISALGGLIVALLFLLNIASKISKPIAKLASATSHVKEGKFDEIEHFETEKGQSDEIVTLIQSFNEMVQGLKEREKVRGVLNKVVSKDIASEILKGQIHLGGEKKEVTIFFADIRQFTSITQNMDPAKLIEMLNACMTKITEVIDQTGGVIDKYVGDEAMALFGAPIPHEDSAFRAVVSAVNIQKIIDQWNTERKRSAEPPIEIGIGINTGEVIAGNMGAENRLNYTVLGSHVNLASRLCSAAKPNEILITESVYNAPKVKESIEVENLEPMEFRGFEGKMPIYRVLKLKNEDVKF